MRRLPPPNIWCAGDMGPLGNPHVTIHLNDTWINIVLMIRTYHIHVRRNFRQFRCLLSLAKILLHKFFVLLC